MRPETHRAALLAAARIAAAASLVGCAGTARTSEPLEAAPTGIGEAWSSTERPVVMPSSEEVARCQELTDAAFAEVRALKEQAPATRDEAWNERIGQAEQASASPEVIACCEALATAESYPNGPEAPPQTGFFDQDCCQLTEFREPACTPWGPPPPPAMPGEHMAADGLLA